MNNNPLSFVSLAMSGPLWDSSSAQQKATVALQKRRANKALRDAQVAAAKQKLKEQAERRKLRAAK